MKIPVLVCAWVALFLTRPCAHSAWFGGERYRDEIFSEVTVQRNLVYGQAVNLATGQNETLLLDLYQPKGDTLSKRPAIVWIHGGGFKPDKDKSEDKFVTLSKRFAKRRYVTTSIDYRLYGDATAEAVVMAYEDAKAAIRWMRANAAAYRIDTTRIVVGGASAGASAAMHGTYEELEGSSGNAGHSSQVSACIDMSGAAADTIMEKGEAPLLIIHGTKDSTVPFLFALQLLERAQQVGIPYELHSIEGGDHDIWEDNEEDMVRWSSDFLYKFVITGVAVPVELASFSARFVSGAVRLEWTTATETNNLGFAIERQSRNDSWQQIAFVPGHGTTTEPQAYEYADENPPAGAYSYRLKQIDSDGSFSYSTIASLQIVAPQAFQLSQNYPNPLILSSATNGTLIQYTLVTESETRLNIFNSLGQLVRRFDLGRQAAGYYDLLWEGRDGLGQLVSQGVYYYQLQSGNGKVTRKMVVF